MTYTPTGSPSTSYTPVLKGATEDPSAVTYSTQVGRYILVNKLCFFTIKLVTTSITKTTLTDAVRISLPFASANNTNQIAQIHAHTENGTPVQNANRAYINPNVSVLTLAQLGLTTAQVDITYALLSLGVLTNTITFEVSGVYEVA
jgi:hypothetical protein